MVCVTKAAVWWLFSENHVWGSYFKIEAVCLEIVNLQIMGIIKINKIKTIGINLQTKNTNKQRPKKTGKKWEQINIRDKTLWYD